MNTRNDRLDKIMNEFDNQMETTKTIPFDKKHIVVEKETLNEDDSIVKLDKLIKDKTNLEKRLSNLIDMKLDDYENKNAYISKEKEINTELKRINDEINDYENIKNTNKNIQEHMKKIEKILETPQTIKEFDENIFNNLVEKIIVGEKDDKGNINPKVVRFILKIGTEYVYDINDDKPVSFRPNNVEKFSKW